MTSRPGEQRVLLLGVETRVELGRERRAARLPPGEEGSQRGQVAHRELGQLGWVEGAAHAARKKKNLGKFLFSR